MVAFNISVQVYKYKRQKLVTEFYKTKFCSLKVTHNLKYFFNFNFKDVFFHMYVIHRLPSPQPSPAQSLYRWTEEQKRIYMEKIIKQDTGPIKGKWGKYSWGLWELTLKKRKRCGVNLIHLYS